MSWFVCGEVDFVCEIEAVKEVIEYYCDQVADVLCMYVEIAAEIGLFTSKRVVSRKVVISSQKSITLPSSGL